MSCSSFIATAEPGDEESVTRAKYFIRDEFLVSRAVLLSVWSVLGCIPLGWFRLGLTIQDHLSGGACWRNWWIHCGQGFICSFGAPWCESLSNIIEPYPAQSWSWSNLGLNNPRSNFDKGKIKPVWGTWNFQLHWNVVETTFHSAPLKVGQNWI